MVSKNFPDDRSATDATQKIATPENNAAFKLLNTSLGTWVLSALFLTLGPYGWQKIENHFKQELSIEAENYRRSRLIEEFSYRLSISYSRLDAIEKRSVNLDEKSSPQPILEWALSPLIDTKDPLVPLFRENKDLSAVSILAEINISFANSIEPGRPSLIRHMRKRIDALSKISSPNQQPITSAQAIKKYLRDEVDHKIWSDTEYSFLSN